jgi:hypothetical protein
MDDTKRFDPIKIFRSDRGTNFVGAVDDLKIDAINVEDGPFRNHMYNSGTVWKFNSPHSSTRRVLEFFQ